MALTDIVAQAGDAQDFVLTLPAGNGAYVPSDILGDVGGVYAVSEIPVVVGGGGGGNIFIIND